MTKLWIYMTLDIFLIEFGDDNYRYADDLSWTIGRLSQIRTTCNWGATRDGIWILRDYYFRIEKWCLTSLIIILGLFQVNMHPRCSTEWDLNRTRLLFQDHMHLRCNKGLNLNLKRFFSGPHASEVRHGVRICLELFFFFSLLPPASLANKINQLIVITKLLNRFLLKRLAL